MFKQYGGLAVAIRTYWKDYGGWHDVIQSPIFHASILSAVAAHKDWISIDWRPLTISMMPTILGFSLAAYAITFSLMGSKLHSALARATDTAGKPLAFTTNATFFHNVFIQSLSLSFAVISKGHLFSDLTTYFIEDSKLRNTLIKVEIETGSFIGCLLLSYAVLLLFSSGLAMFRLGRLTPITVQQAPPANDTKLIVDETKAFQVYGIRWRLIRRLAKILRVKG